MGDKVINEIVKILNSKFSILKLSCLIMFLSCDESLPHVQLIYPLDTINPIIYNPNNEGIWECPFNPSVWPDGNYNIYAKAIDYNGNEGKSNYVNVYIPEGIVSTTSLLLSTSLILVTAVKIESSKIKFILEVK